MDCIFCTIVEENAATTIRWQNEHWIAINDIHPKADTHVLLISRKHIPSLAETSDADDVLLATTLPTVRALAQEVGIVESGYRMVNNCGRGAGQMVDHLHFHVLSGGLRTDC